MEDKVNDNGNTDKLSQVKRDLLKKRLDKLTSKNTSPKTHSQTIINKVTYPDQVGASAAQKRLWYLHILEPENTADHIPVNYRIHGDLNIDAFCQSIQLILDRHEVLRTQIVNVGGKPLQKILDAATLDVDIVDLSKLENSDRNRKQSALLEQLKEEVFTLAIGPLWRVKLLKLNANEFIVAMVFHHAIMDGRAIDLFWSELSSFYANICSHNDLPQPISNLQFADCVLWQNQWLQTDESKQQLNYWLEHLDGDLPVLDLPLDFSRPAQQSFQGAAQRGKIDAQLARKLTELGRQQGATLFMVILSAFILQLLRYSRQEDIIVGTSVSGRSQPQLDSVIGDFANILPLCFQLEHSTSYTALLDSVKKICLAGFSHQDIPFSRILEALNPPRDLSRTPVFQVLFNYQVNKVEATTFADLSATKVKTDITVAHTDVCLWMDETYDGVLFELEYCSALFQPQTIKYFVQQFIFLLESLVDTNLPYKTNLPASQLALRNNKELQQINQWNDTQKDFRHHTSIAAWLSEHWQKRGNNTAIICGSEALSYTQLEKRSNQLAHYLKDKGLVGGQLVGVSQHRSINMLVSIIAIWKCGAGYVPLDPEFPLDRLRYMIEQAKLEIALCQTSTLTDLSFFSGNLICIDGDEQQAIHCCRSSKLTIKQEPNNTAYVIFTSGSTGSPKGVKVPQRAVMNFLASMAERPGLTAGDNLLAVTTLSFDISALELYLPLLVGATVVIAAKDEAEEGSELITLISQHEISVMQATPSTWHLLLRCGWAGKSGFKALCGGEALPKHLAISLLPCVDSLWNMYGPTEATVWSSCSRITDAEAPLLIGQPIANTQCYILDDALQTLPIGVPGELYIGGAGVTTGYLWREELTAERFISDPFSTSDTARLYRTGDLVRWRHNGELEYFHRLDNQVKVRGFRIELEEIEAALVGLHQVSECAVAVKSFGKTDQRLVAYCCFESGKYLTITDMRKTLAKQLPDYMIPQRLVEIENLPLTPNGKIDRKNLPDPFHFEEVEDIVEPRTKVEKAIALIWCQILKVSQVNLNSYFFDIGGYSLLSMEVIFSVEKQFGIRLGPRDMVFNTLEQISALVEQKSGAITTKVDDGNTKMNGGLCAEPITDSDHESESSNKHIMRGLVGRLLKRLKG